MANDNTSGVTDERGRENMPGHNKKKQRDQRKAREGASWEVLLVS